MVILIYDRRDIKLEDIIELYTANKWAIKAKELDK